MSSTNKIEPRPRRTFNARTPEPSPESQQKRGGLICLNDYAVEPDQDGYFFRAVSPITGKLTEVVLRIDNIGEETCRVRFGVNFTTYHEVEASPGITTVVFDMKVVKGEPLTAQIVSGQARGIWTSVTGEAVR